MGVTKLWEVLKDVKKEKCIEELEGQIWAVDLATWVCEAECVKGMHSFVNRPYLRNLFFRVNGLLKSGIKLVFVIDGKAPELKLNTIAKRLGSSGDKTCKIPASKGTRSRLNAKFKECCILLDSLGIPWLKAEAEAEALCAALNNHGLVDAVVTSDGDSFLYGARMVYRNFSIDRKDTTIECYEMEDIEKKLGLNQNSMIALGLLLGCDYAPKGVVGVGVAQAVRLLSTWKSQDPLEMFKQWRKEGNSSNTFEHMKKPPHCSTCGHQGLKRDHSKSSCSTCGRACAASASNSSGKPIVALECVCPWHKAAAKKKESAVEDKVRTLALKDPNFPPLDVVSEFLKEQRCAEQHKNLEEVKPRLVTRSPMLDISCKYLKEKLDWESSYALSKVLPMLTRYILELKAAEMNSSAVVQELPSYNTKQIEIQEILKTRVKDRVQSLEVKWFFFDTINIETEENYEPITLESESIMQKAFPLLVEKFYDKLQKEREDKKKAKLEAQKLERKMKREAKLNTKLSSSREAPKCKRVTDFFAVTKQRNKKNTFETSSKISDREQDQSLNTMQSLEQSLASLSIENHKKSDRITAKITKTDFLTFEKGRNESSVAGRNSGRSKYQENTFRASSELRNESKKDIKSTYVVLFSSDSDDSDVEHYGVTDLCDVRNSAENAENYNKPVDKIMTGPCSLSKNVENNERELSSASSVLPSWNEITFSNDINFSLDSSLLRTPKHMNDSSVIGIIPDDQGNPENSPSPLKPTLHERNSLNVATLDVAERKTPRGKLMKENCYRSAADSPVFMTLMDRLKARRVTSRSADE